MARSRIPVPASVPSSQALEQPPILHSKEKVANWYSANTSAGAVLDRHFWLHGCILLSLLFLSFLSVFFAATQPVTCGLGKTRNGPIEAGVSAMADSRRLQEGWVCSCERLGKEFRLGGVPQHDRQEVGAGMLGDGRTRRAIRRAGEGSMGRLQEGGKQVDMEVRENPLSPRAPEAGHLNDGIT
ncbi:hypothetical protein GQ53DRAFT_747260 [Thozetella sp. PMI_491]|nr:hypothetical protein GQ53DRAFT_747260 [Thozetella sp. PMI_491]